MTFVFRLLAGEPSVAEPLRAVLQWAPQEAMPTGQSDQLRHGEQSGTACQRGAWTPRWGRYVTRKVEGKGAGAVGGWGVMSTEERVKERWK